MRRVEIAMWNYKNDRCSPLLCSSIYVAFGCLGPAGLVEALLEDRYDWAPGHLIPWMDLCILHVYKRGILVVINWKSSHQLFIATELVITPVKYILAVNHLFFIF